MIKIPINTIESRLPYVIKKNCCSVGVDTASRTGLCVARTTKTDILLDYSFLDMQTETGDIRKKAFDLFPSVSFPDLFMERMEAGKIFTLFDPKEIEDLYGKRLQDSF